MPTPIAIVEDNADIREGLCHLIEQDGDFTCVCACRNAESALLRIPAARPEIVIMDLQLPGMSGIDCTAALRRAMPALQIIVFTVHHDRERIFRALEAGAVGYLLKNTRPDVILSSLRDLRAGGSPISGEVGRKIIEGLQQPTAAPAPSDPLTPREQEVMELLAVGHTAKEIAARLDITADTVNAHLKHIYQKLAVRSRVEAVIKFLGRSPAHPDRTSKHMGGGC